MSELVKFVDMQRRKNIQLQLFVCIEYFRRCVRQSQLNSYTFVSSYSKLQNVFITSKFHWNKLICRMQTKNTAVIFRPPASLKEWWHDTVVESVRCYGKSMYRVEQKKTGPFSQVCNPCIWRHKKAIYAIKMFRASSGIRKVSWILSRLNILCIYPAK